MEEQEEQQVKQKSGKKKWLLLAVGGLFVLLVALAGTLYLLGMFPGLGDETAQADTPAVNEVMPLAPLVVNLADEDAIHYARIGISLGISNPNPGTPVVNEALMIPKLKDQLLVTVGRRTSAELVGFEVKELLKKEVLESVNALLPEDGGKVLEVYFTEFIVQ